MAKLIVTLRSVGRMIYMRILSGDRAFLFSNQKKKNAEAIKHENSYTNTYI